jgi:hypothetical protein
MNEKTREWVQALEAEWSKPDGFLGRAREGAFDDRQGTAFVLMLEKIKPSENATIGRRLVALLWYIPIFLGWQKGRVAEKNGDAAAFEQLTNRVQGIIEDILGVP